MVYYVLPSTGFYGGVKVAYQLADVLRELGVRIAIASPNGQAATWFLASTPVVDRDEVLAQLTSDDIVLFSLPDDYDIVKTTPARIVFHCVGTDPRINHFLTDEQLTSLSTYPQSTRYLEEHSGRPPIDVGIPISNEFFFDGSPKRHMAVSYMPRRGGEICLACCHAVPELTTCPIQDLPHEIDVAKQLKGSGFYLATSVGEWFGLPALEAMAAGCVVLTVPVVGGMDYLVHGENCILCEPEDMPERLRWLTDPAQVNLVARLRDRGIATAYRYTLSNHRRKVAHQLQGPLSFLRS